MKGHFNELYMHNNAKMHLHKNCHFSEVRLFLYTILKNTTFRSFWLIVRWMQI